MFGEFESAGLSFCYGLTLKKFRFEHELKKMQTK